MENGKSLKGSLIKCGWENCPSFFSAVKDMNEHVLWMHLEYFEVNTKALRMMQPKENLPPSTPKPTVSAPLSPACSIDSNSSKTSVKYRCMYECSEFDTPEEARAHHTAVHTPRIESTIQLERQISLESRMESSSTPKRPNDSVSEPNPKKVKLESPEPPVAPSTSEELEDLPIDYSRCTRMSDICQLVIDHIGRLPEKRFENPDRLEFCLPCFRFKPACKLQHDGYEAKLKSTWSARYMERMKKKNILLTKELLIEQMAKIKKKYIEEKEKPLSV